MALVRRCEPLNPAVVTSVGLSCQYRMALRATSFAREWPFTAKIKPTLRTQQEGRHQATLLENRTARGGP